MSSIRKVLFEIGGFEVMSGSVYMIKDKPDPTAPTGFVNRGITKIPQDGVSETVCVGRVRTGNNGEGVWDTGFYQHSPCYKYKSDEEKKALTDKMVKNLQIPYQEKSGNSKAFNNQDNEPFFRDWSATLYSGKILNMDDPMERMELYFALNTQLLAIDGEEGDPKYVRASYKVVDVNKVTKDKNEKENLFFNAMIAANALMVDKKSNLIAILTWLDMPVAEHTENETLVSMIMNYVKDSYDKPKAFMAAVEEAKTEKGLDKFFIFKRLKELSKKNGKLSRSNSGIFSYENVEVGADLKGAADRIAKDLELNEIKKEILFD